MTCCGKRQSSPLFAPCQWIIFWWTRPSAIGSPYPAFLSPIPPGWSVDQCPGLWATGQPTCGKANICLPSVTSCSCCRISGWRGNVHEKCAFNTDQLVYLHFTRQSQHFNFTISQDSSLISFSIIYFLLYYIVGRMSKILLKTQKYSLLLIIHGSLDEYDSS